MQDSSRNSIGGDQDRSNHSVIQPPDLMECGYMHFMQPNLQPISYDSPNRSSIMLDDMYEKNIEQTDRKDDDLLRLLSHVHNSRIFSDEEHYTKRQHDDSGCEELFQAPNSLLCNEFSPANRGVSNRRSSYDTSELVAKKGPLNSVTQQAVVALKQAQYLPDLNFNEEQACLGDALTKSRSNNADQIGILPRIGKQRSSNAHRSELESDLHDPPAEEPLQKRQLCDILKSFGDLDGQQEESLVDLDDDTPKLHLRRQGDILIPRLMPSLYTQGSTSP